MSVDKRKALGRGLSALLPGGPAGAPPKQREYFFAAIEDVYKSGDNPRQRFDEAGLAELTESIREHGLIQPLVVRNRDGSNGGFTLIAGERRWRAAQKAGLKEVPVVVKEASSTEAFELALVENLQRRDLNPIEEAEAYRRLREEHNYTEEHLAKRVAKDRSTIANSLRLLKLPRPVQLMVEDDTLQMGHARALLGLEKDLAIEAAALQVIKSALSVRQTEALVKRLRTTPTKKKDGARGDKSPNIKDLETRLERAMGVPVRVVERGPGAGKVEIDYANLDELDRVLDRLLRP